MDKLIKSLFCLFLITSMSASIAGVREYTDEAGIVRYEYIRGYVDPNTVVSREALESFNKNEERRSAERSIEKIGKKNGLSDMEIYDLKQALLKDNQKEQKDNTKSLDGIKPNSGKVKSTDWTK